MGKVISIVGTLLLFLFIGLFSPFIAAYLNIKLGTNVTINSFDSNFVMTIVSSLATLLGISFAIYGWFSIKEVPEIVEKTVDKKIEEVSKKTEHELNKLAEASQKIQAVYSMKDPVKKIILIEDVLQLYPNMFNARVTMAYTYWYDLQDLSKAEKWFMEELQNNTNNTNAMCDLVALYNELKEFRPAFLYAKQSIGLNPSTKQYLLDDTRLSKELKQKIRDEL